ncbi:integrase [Sandaracinomonas limnophila]|uniref:Integrase n=1 Tax=Sandaracinomonas limnophila TaxID=1862386 RepID=A0A437PW39_9BACT|nr:tyrosine-type recombinase/integrase [Sandaracinomonas limnophila]RVU26466.1 integrase [Sandaracinomonas limnophila]
MNQDLVNFFLEHLQIERRLSPYTLRSYQTDLLQFSSFISEEFTPEKSIVDLNSKEIRLWLVYLANQSLDNRSINRKLATLRTFYKYLQRTGKAIENPMISIKMVKTSKKLPQFLRESEMEKIAFHSEISSFEELQQELIFQLFYGTGMRLSELINLQVNQIDFLNHQIKVLGKRNKERIIPAPKSIFELLEKYLKIRPVDSEILLTNTKGKALYPMFVQRIIKKIISQTSTIEKQSPHVLRHSYATHLLNKGADLNAIKELLGHANLAATQVYTHNSLEKMKEIYKQAHPKGGK